MVDCSSDRQYLARCAYGDSEKSIEVHGAKMETFNVDIRKNGAMRNRAMVLSSLTGLCAAAGVAAVAVGAPQMLIGLQSVRSLPCMILCTVAGGVCLAYVSTSSFSFERTIYDLELQREMWEIDNHLSGELQEMLAIYKGQGLTEEEALIVTRIFARQKTVFANLMMVEELGYSRLEPPTTSEAAMNVGGPAIMGFMIGVATPLLCLAGSLLAFSCGQGDSVGSNCRGAVAGSSVLATRTKLLGAGIFCTCNAVLSYVQTEVFFGAYAHMPALIHTTVSNAIGIGSVFGLCYLAARWA
ncbi:putative VIT family [Leishmania utingensis]|uniref:VIT family n=1 Tax=Leishmania utingensis TaxID=653362 RepID=A0AAW3B317_9TRYP